MQEVKFESNYGNFDYRLTAVVGETLTPATLTMVIQGLANVAYRVVGSYVDKALGVKSKSKGGDGRTAVLYSEQDGETINAAVSTKLKEIEAENNDALKPLQMSFAVIGEHAYGAETKPSKEAEALWVKVPLLTGTEFSIALEKLGLDESYTDESGIRACHKMLLEADRARREAAKEETFAKLGLTK